MKVNKFIDFSIQVSGDPFDSGEFWTFDVDPFGFHLPSNGNEAEFKFMVKTFIDMCRDVYGKQIQIIENDNICRWTGEHDCSSSGCGCNIDEMPPGC